VSLTPTPQLLSR